MVPVTVEQEPTLIVLWILNPEDLLIFSGDKAEDIDAEFLMMFPSSTGLYPPLFTMLTSLSCGRLELCLSSRREEVERTSQAIQQLSLRFSIVFSSLD